MLKKYEAQEALISINLPYQIVKMPHILLYFSFPESQGDALLIEVQDTKHNTRGQAVIPILSIAENFVRSFLFLLLRRKSFFS